MVQMNQQKRKTPEERSGIVADLYQQVQNQYYDNLRKEEFYCETKGYKFVRNPLNRPFSIKVFSEILNINYTTVFSWISKRRNPPDYVIEGMKTVLQRAGYEIKE